MEVSFPRRIRFSPLAGADVGKPWTGLTVHAFPAVCSAWLPPAGPAADSSFPLCPAHIVSVFPKADKQCPHICSTSLRCGQEESLPSVPCCIGSCFVSTPAVSLPERWESRGIEGSHPRRAYPPSFLLAHNPSTWDLGVS